MSIADNYQAEINNLAQRRFPDDNKLAQEAIRYIQTMLMADEKLASSDTISQELISIMTVKQLSVFWQKQTSPPHWLSQQHDFLYHIAYRLLTQERHSMWRIWRTLLATMPKREWWKLKAVINAVKTNCTRKGDQESASKLPTRTHLPEGGVWNELRMCDMLLRLLNKEYVRDDVSEINKLLLQLSHLIRLTEEECLFLRLHFYSGLSTETITLLLPSYSEVQVDRIINKAMTHLREVAKHVGLMQGMFTQPDFPIPRRFKGIIASPYAIALLGMTVYQQQYLKATSCLAEENLAISLMNDFDGKNYPIFWEHLNCCPQCYHWWLEAASHLRVKDSKEVMIIFWIVIAIILITTGIYVLI
jgi:hypothetical protein